MIPWLTLLLFACNAEKPPLQIDSADTAIVWTGDHARRSTLREQVEPMVSVAPVRRPR